MCYGLKDQTKDALMGFSWLLTDLTHCNLQFAATLTPIYSQFFRLLRLFPTVVRLIYLYIGFPSIIEHASLVFVVFGPKIKDRF